MTDLKNVNKDELIAMLAEETELTKKNAGVFLEGFKNVISDFLVEGRKVSIQGFGTFESVDVKESTKIYQLGEHKGEEYTIPAHRKPKFRPSKALKDMVKGE